MIEKKSEVVVEKKDDNTEINENNFMQNDMEKKTEYIKEILDELS